VKACASLPSLNPAPSHPVERPVVFINKVLEPRLIIREMRRMGPLDRNLVQIEVATNDKPSVLIDRWSRAKAVLALPTRLVDDEVRWAVLAQGRVGQVDKRLSAKSDEQLLELKDDWTQQLDEPVAAVWWQTIDGLIFDDTRAAIMRVGDAANRSDVTWSIGEQVAYVFQEEGQPWTVSTSLTTISAFGGLDISLRMVPAEIRESPLLESIDLSRPIGDALEKILEPYGLVIQRDLIRESGKVVELRSVRPAKNGRTVQLAWSDQQHPLGQVLKIDTHRPAQMAQSWIAQADGWLVESTFELVAGWDTALEGAPDSSYSRSNNPDFANYANVYRLWALNEDGHFTGLPFNRGAAFDLASLFNQHPIRPRPLRFLPGLTLDDSGARRSPMVEISTDAGLSWSPYPGRIVHRSDRAAVYLDDTTLPISFFDAAKLGNAKVRVTASLQSPVPVQVLRWSGNPFSGTNPARVFGLGDAFVFRRVATGSVNHNGVISGVLSAMQDDQTNAMDSWLIKRMELADQLIGDAGGRATITLAGVWPLLRVGDRLVHTAGPGIDAADNAEAIIARGAVISSIKCRWSGKVAPVNRAGTIGGMPDTIITVLF